MSQTLSLADAKSRETSYHPSDPAVLEQLARITIVPFVGPAAAGKNFLMSQSGLPSTGTLTSRPERASDDKTLYRYLTNEELLAQIAAGSLVQYAVNLAAETMYATDITCYRPGAPNVMDTFSFSVEPLRRLGFAAVRPIAVLTPAEQWTAQLEERFTGQSTKFCRDRLDEAAQSIAWILHDPSDKLILINRRDAVTENLIAMHSYISGEKPVTAQGVISVAHDMLAAIPGLRQTYGAE